VYYTVFTALALLVFVAWATSRARPARGQMDVTVEPAMVRGAANAPVTIIEFSDYQ
jgi:protein-disulfide isomerase